MIYPPHPSPIFTYVFSVYICPGGISLQVKQSGVNQGEETTPPTVATYVSALIVLVRAYVA